MVLLKTNGAGGELIIPEHNDQEWEHSVLTELDVRLNLLEDSVDESGYKIHEECRTLIAGLLAYHGVDNE